MGLTGVIGSGKSTVASVWKEQGAVIVEGDVLGKLALQAPEIRRRLVRRFGKKIIDESGNIITYELANSAFKEASSQRDLTAITFPYIYRLATIEFERLKETYSAVVFDAAMIFEWGIENDFDCIITVVAPRERLIGNAVARMGISSEQVEKRLLLQLDQEEKAQRANYVLGNDGTLDDLKIRALELWKTIIM